MKKDISIWQKLSQAADLPGEDIPGQSIVELAGNSRVLIEHHCGVREYSREVIGIKVKHGVVCVSGSDLELTHMTKEQLIIRGRIEAITVHRGRNT